MTRKASPPPPGDQPRRTAAPGGQQPAWMLAFVVLALVAAALLIVLPGQSNTVTLTYSQFLQDVNAHQVKMATVNANGAVSGTLSSGKRFTSVVPVALEGSGVLGAMEKAGVKIDATTSTGTSWAGILSWLVILVPLGLMAWLWLGMRGRGGAGMPGVLGAGRSKVQVFDAERPATTFADVAG